MIFHKTMRNILFLSRKCNLIFKSPVSRFSNLCTHLRGKRNYSRYTNLIFASSAAFGFTLYIAYKKNALCEVEIIDVIDNKELNLKRDLQYDEAIHKSRDILQRIKDEYGIPGMVVGVSVNGKNVWSEGLGYSDVENRVLCSADTVMRIASISKSITMAAVAKLWERGKLDLDKPIQNYVPYFPSKTFDGKKVTITCRQLVSHLGGIRHYDKSVYSLSKNKAKDDKTKENEKSDSDLKEFYIKDFYKDIKSSIDIFKDDPLIANPGSKFYYSTYGWTLISAIVEGASEEQFSTHMTNLFKFLGMRTTYLDVNDTLIYHRSKNYVKNKKGVLINAPYVDNSCKWAGGGFLSTVGDLLHFGNAMLYSLQYKPIILNTDSGNECAESEQNIKNNQLLLSDNLPLNIRNLDQKISNVVDGKDKLSNNQNLPGYLNSKTVKAMWSPIADTKEGKYGMGWSMFPEAKECQFCESKKFSVYHTGGAVGASSILLILPQCDNEMNDFNHPFLPKGIIVTIITNLQSINLSKTALAIAQIFDNDIQQF